MFLIFVLPLIILAGIHEAKVLISADIDDVTNGRKSFVYERPSLEEYKQQRKLFIDEEEKRFLGANLILSEEEQIVNEYVMRLKQAELNQGFNDSYNFIPARHFFEMFDRFNDSKLFQFIRRLPKGGVLHAHDTAIGTVDLIVGASYNEGLWQKGDFEDDNGPQFIFSRNQPAGNGWKLVSDIRRETEAAIYDAKVKDLFSLNCADPINTYKSIDEVWSKFQKLFISLEPLITYEPVWRKYYYDSLQQFYDDKVYYLEFRGVLPNVYDLNGKIYTSEEIIQIYVDETDKFRKTHPEFLGAKFIFAPIRFANDTICAGFFNTVKKLHLKYPNFVVGFDLVGQEDHGRPLIEFVPELLKLPESIHFFFHAGETNWYGMKTDKNLVDAILLGTKRIGHGFALLKHPSILKELKRRQICVEINPVSNQVLKLVQDYRNHPAALFFSDNYPVVVSSDDPSFWQATPLSHDFYLAFLGIASAHHDLRLLKKLALNSIEFSAMNQEEKLEAKHKWKHSWNKAIKELSLEISSGLI